MMKPNKFFTTFLVMALVIAGCASPGPTPAPATPTTAPPPTQPAPPDESWQKVQQTGVLRVGTTADYPPFEYVNENNQLDGFDIALIQQIGQKLGLKVELNNFGFDNLPAAVAIGQVDVAIGALSVTPERQAVANFSNVYYAGSDAVLSRPEANAENIKNPAALAVARLGVQVNSIYETYAQQQLLDAGLMPKQNLLIYVDNAQAVNELKAKRIDAVWMDLKPAQAFANAGGVKVLVQDLNQQLYAIGMVKGADALRDKINEALTQLQNDGTLANLQVQYLGIKPEDVVPPQPLPTPIPQPTPAPPACLDGAEWVKDLSYDDQHHTKPPVLNPGQPFTKGWRIRNIGTCTWKSGYTLAYSSGNVPAAQMGGQPIPVTKEVKPGETFDFQVNLIAPVVPGRYQGYWDMRNAQNQKFGETVWVDISVPGVATPTPKPTQTPVPDVDFTANPTTITAGQPVYFEWKTENVRTVYFYHDGQKWTEQEVAKNGSATEYPQYSLNYYLHADQMNGETIQRQIWITVNPAPVDAPFIEYISATPPEIIIGTCTRVDWSVKGKLDQVDLLVNDVMVLNQTAMVGNYNDCPTTAGPHAYTIVAYGPGGKNTGQTTVNVRGVPVTQAPTEPPPPTQPPVTEVPTEPPPPTEAPTEAPPPPTEAPVTEPPPPTEPPVTEAPTEVPPPPTEAPVTEAPVTEAPTEPPPPVIEKPVIQGFDVVPASIVEGECVTASWTAGGGTTYLELYLDANMIWFGPELNFALPVCDLPKGEPVVQFTLVAYNNAGEKVSSDATVQVSPPAAAR